MADSKDPLAQLIDLVVYAPVGLLTLAQKELPELIATGKTRVDNQLTLAKFIGRMAFRQGSNEFKRRMQNAERARQSTPVPELATEPLALVAGERSSAGHTRGAAGDVASAAAELPIDGYDSLAASQVVLRLGSLDGIELETVRQYEEGNRARRTILGKIAQLQAR